MVELGMQIEILTKGPRQAPIAWMEKLQWCDRNLCQFPHHVTITMDNPSPIPHAIAVEGNGVDKDGQTVTKGGKSTITVTLKPGKYTFYCPVDGHRAAGMKGTLTVQ